MKYEDQIGKNIKTIRNLKGLTQQNLADKCGFSNTTLSAYENGNKKPSLDTIATIAKELGVSIERLYYGDESSSFINSAPNTGRKIVNSFYFLWEQEVISYNQGIISSKTQANYEKNTPMILYIHKYPIAISRLLTHLNEFKLKKTTFSDAEGYLEMLLSSVAEEINSEICREKELGNAKNEIYEQLERL